MLAFMVLCLPRHMILAARNLEPWSIIIANSTYSPVTGWIHFPPSASKDDHFGGRGSSDAACLWFTLCFSLLMAHSKSLASCNTCFGAPLFCKASTIWRVFPWPEAACNLYNCFLIISTCLGSPLNIPSLGFSFIMALSSQKLESTWQQEPHCWVLPCCLRWSHMQAAPDPKPWGNWDSPPSSSTTMLWVISWRMAETTRFANSGV